MKPPVHSSSPAASDMADAELLQAARDMPQHAPAPTLDAIILSAAAQRATEVRKARAASETPAAVARPAKTLSPWQGFSRWLFGDGDLRGHFGQAVAVCLVAGVALGLALQVERKAPPASPEIAAMKPAPAPAPAPEPAAPPAIQREKAPTRATPSAQTKLAAAPATVNPLAAADNADKVQLAAASPAPPPPQAEARSRMSAGEMEPSPPAAAAPAPAPARQMEGLAERQAAGAAAVIAAPLAKAVPALAQDAAKARESNVETEIDAQLKRVLELRRAGKEEEAQRLLRELRARYPDGNIDERLRQREKEESR